MPRPRQYPSAAARQAACRQRRAEREVKLRQLVIRVFHLAQAVATAARAGDPLACTVNVDDPDRMLLLLTSHFAGRAGRVD